VRICSGFNWEPNTDNHVTAVTKNLFKRKVLLQLTEVGVKKKKKNQIKTNSRLESLYTEYISFLNDQTGAPHPSQMLTGGWEQGLDSRWTVAKYGDHQHDLMKKKTRNSGWLRKPRRAPNPRQRLEMSKKIYSGVQGGAHMGGGDLKNFLSLDPLTEKLHQRSVGCSVCGGTARGKNKQALQKLERGKRRKSFSKSNAHSKKRRDNTHLSSRAERTKGSVSKRGVFNG